MFWPYRAKVLHDLSRDRIVDIQADLVAARAGPINSGIRSNHERTNLAAEAVNNFAAFFHCVGRWIIDKQIHAAGPARGSGDVVFAIEAQRASRKIELMVISQTLKLHFAGTKIHSAQPRGPVVFLEINLQKVPRLAVVVGHQPTFPYIRTARRLAERFRLEDRRVLEFLLEIRLIRDAPFRYECGRGRAAVRFSKSRFDSPANVLFVIVGFVRPYITRRGSLRSIEIEIGRQSRICATDQRRPGAWPKIILRFELFLIRIWRRW